MNMAEALRIVLALRLRSSTLSVQSCLRICPSSSGMLMPAFHMPNQNVLKSRSISATEWLDEVFPNEPSWTSADTVRLAPVLAAHGVDLLDVSSGGNSPRQKFAFKHAANQAEFAHAVRKSVLESNITVAGTDSAPLLVSAVGGIKTGALATEVLENGWADVVMSGRWFQQNPGLVWEMARELGVAIHLAHQIEWPFAGRAAAKKALTEE
jgi:2,4-dienoyl-CoA reductase-like NADH-dependent reductase (Old Yellow Enzyme family)